MSSHRTILSAFKLQKSLSHPYHIMRASRIGVVNRYKYVSKISLKRPLMTNTNQLFACNRITRSKMSTSRGR